MINKLLATTVNDIIGPITPPIVISGVTDNNASTALVKVMNVALNLVLVIAGIFVLFNLILAGFQYVTAGGDSKKVSEANLKITNTVIGLIIIVVAPVLAAIFGIVFFGKWDAILNPTIKTVGP